MRFECVTCSKIYLELADLAGEISRTVSGICEPCCRLRIGDDACELASQRAAATIERRSTKHLKLLSGTPEMKG